MATHSVRQRCRKRIILCLVLGISDFILTFVSRNRHIS